MGRPSWNERRCPQMKENRCGGGYDTFEKIYARRGRKMIPIGRRCSKCGHVVYDTE